MPKNKPSEETSAGTPRHRRTQRRGARKQAIRLKVTARAPLPRTASKFGGRPYHPPESAIQ